MRTKTPLQVGFTLIEVLVVAPIVILLIGGVIAFMSSLTGDGLKTQQRNTLAYNTQDALDIIDQDIAYALNFKTTTGAVANPQGLQSSSNPFTNSDNKTLIIESAATDKNPLDPSRKLISVGGGACDSSKALYTLNTVYFVNNNTLYKRLILSTKSACTNPYQLNSCSPDVMSAATPPSNCKAEDQVLLTNVENFSVEYKIDGTTTTASDAGNANNIVVTLAAAQKTAGDTISYAGTLRSTRINAYNGALVDNTPALASAGEINDTSPDTYTCRWQPTGNANSYNTRYRFNAGAWTNGPQNTSSTSFNVDVTLRRGQSIECEVTANLSSGRTDTYTPSVTPINIWTTCNLQNGWENYGGEYPEARFSKTSAKVIMLSGLVRNGSTANGTTICQLPEGYRPSKQLVFQVANGTSVGRVDIYPDGKVGIISAANTWLNLATISFIPSNAGYNFINLTGQNGWTSFDNATRYALPSVTKDSLGRAHIQGLAKGTTTSVNTTAFALPNGYAPASGQSNLFAAYAGDQSSGNGMSISSASAIQTRSSPTSYWSLQAMFYPSGVGSWTAASPLLNSWVNYPSSTWDTARYTKGSDGIVSLTGLVRGGSTTNGAVIFNLPVNYRPGSRIICDVSSAASGSNDIYSRVDIMTDGRVLVYSPVENGYLSLAGCDFIAEQ